jgi:hypothetical protein
MKISAPARYAFCFVVSAFMILVGVASAFARPRRYTQGPCGSMFGAKVCTFYQAKAGQVSEFGMSVPLAAIQEASSNPPMVRPPKPVVSVPFAPAVEKQTGFTFANIYWHAHGHPPGAYMTPHFDFHFYFIPEQRLKDIDCKDASKPQTLPAGYALPDVNVPAHGEVVGLCVPAMGMHAIPDADLARTTPWEASLVVGYYAGKPIFIEPMVTRARLLKERKFSLAVPQIEKAPGVRYPTRFRAVYLPKSKTYDLIFSY